MSKQMSLLETSVRDRRNHNLEQHEDINFIFTAKSMGPEADPSTFHKLLNYSSTWSIIDRDGSQGYIPVWELLRDLGDEFEEAASVLETTWRKDELKKEEKWEEKCKDKENAAVKIVKDELQCIKESHLQSAVRILNAVERKSLLA